MDIISDTLLAELARAHAIGVVICISNDEANVLFPASTLEDKRLLIEACAAMIKALDIVLDNELGNPT